MSTERVFLDWYEPCLPQAAAWLKDQLTSESVIVTPGARSGRRLMELLVEQAGGQLINPPRITTLGHLAEGLFTPSLPMAGFATSRLILAQVLAQMPTDHLSALLAEPPAEDDLRSWLELAGRLLDLFTTLAGGHLQATDVLEHCGAITDFPEVQRWEVLCVIYENYVEALANHQLTDSNLARFEALQEERISFGGRLFLVGTVDINALTGQVLQQVQDRCVALIHAPSSLADHFGAFGELNQTAWLERSLAIDPEHLRTAILPEDQVRVVLEKLSEIPSPKVNEITLGVGDEQMGPLIEQLTLCANVPTRWPRDRQTHLSRPATLLTALGTYAAGHQTRDLGVLLRHPDMAIKLQEVLEFKDPAVLDQYISRHLQLRLSSDSPQDYAQHLTQLKQVQKVLDDLLGSNIRQKQTLDQWSLFIEELLAVIYEPQQFNKHQSEDLAIIESLRAIGTILEQWSPPPPESPPEFSQKKIPETEKSSAPSAFPLPLLSFHDALALLTDQLQEVVLPKPSDEPAIEILGWLELHLDDAPNLLICGFNEGLIPGPLGANAFLPDSVRAQLGLSCDQSRLARDRYMIEAILASRPNVCLIAGRFNTEGQPIMPSRLTLMDKPDQLPATIARFSEPPSQSNILFLPPPADETSATQWIPKPVPPAKPITELSVTAFKDYLACPYRFYLKHICKLRQPDPFEPQLGAAAFGNLAHDVLQVFGSHSIADSTQFKDIEAFLFETLDTLCEQKYGKHLLPAVHIQREQLRLRLEVFAQRQAILRSDGWHIVSERVESKLEVDFPVDGLPFSLVGRVDRIDRHEDGRYRIIDYKTGNNALKPEDTHRFGPKNDKQWKDLQLPLYHQLTKSIVLNSRVELGYFLLAKTPKDIQYCPAPWGVTELDEATKLARTIVRNIRRGLFWPPQAPPVYSDGLEGICQDHYPLRSDLIAMMGDDA